MKFECFETIWKHLETFLKHVSSAGKHFLQLWPSLSISEQCFTPSFVMLKFAVIL